MGIIFWFAEITAETVASATCYKKRMQIHRKTRNEQSKRKWNNKNYVTKSERPR